MESKLIINKIDKTTQRQQLIKIRNNIPNRELVLNKVWQKLHTILTQFATINSIGTYSAFGQEFPILNFFVKNWINVGIKKRIYLPIIDKTTKSMQFRHWHKESKMAVDDYGISYPVEGELFNPQLLVIPCVGFTEDGFRLGYGGGYYDRYLAKQLSKPITIGIAYSKTQLTQFDVKPYDQKLDFIITEEKIFTVNN